MFRRQISGFTFRSPDSSSMDTFQVSVFKRHGRVLDSRTENRPMVDGESAVPRDMGGF
ncbi:hypothetical protein PCANC_22377 [Puccinia coronata f. sp. avenae]|uniref:Uncharacterized protein n=1 Tax=Puccinia coronata f. sp. avenae TaxID=200324 RepID=A0A2N5TT63_9BASI|nr:hypothetical protein PCANC_22377 [Puccinia coronata f. sp. avenae]